jgi:hypothetical protein
MAPNATNRNPGRMARVFHFLFPTRSATVVALTVEVAALLFHAPAAAHLLAALVTHAVIAATAKRRERS